MKLPWSTKKKAEYEYTKYSAPVVNGILRRNIKGSSSVPDLRGLDDLRVSFADLPIRTSSSQSLNGMVCTPTTERSRRSTTTTNAMSSGNSSNTLDRRQSKDDRKKRGDGRVGVKEGSTRRNSAQAEDDKSKSENRRQNTQQQKRSNRDRRAKATEATPDRRKELRRRSSTGNMRSITNTSNRVANNKLKLTTSIISEGSGSSASVSDTVGSLDNPKRLGDLAGDELANSYGKWESNGTIETAVSSGSEESRPTRKLLQEQSQSLNELLDEKIQAKMRRGEKEKRKIIDR
jgi:hypothetical protein